MKCTRWRFAMSNSPCGNSRPDFYPTPPWITAAAVPDHVRRLPELDAAWADESFAEFSARLIAGTNPSSCSSSKIDLAPDAYKQMLITSTHEDLITTAAVTGVKANWLKGSLEAVGIDPKTKAKVGKFAEHLGNYHEERDGGHRRQPHADDGDGTADQADIRGSHTGFSLFPARGSGQ